MKFAWKWTFLLVFSGWHFVQKDLRYPNKDYYKHYLMITFLFIPIMFWED
jgi:hypothetical protein